MQASKRFKNRFKNSNNFGTHRFILDPLNDVQDLEKDVLKLWIKFRPAEWREALKKAFSSWEHRPDPLIIEETNF